MGSVVVAHPIKTHFISRQKEHLLTFNIKMKSFIGLSALVGAAMAAPQLISPYGLNYGLGLPYHGLSYGAVPISSEIKEVKVQAPEVKVDALPLTYAYAHHAPLAFAHHAPLAYGLGAPLVIPGVAPVVAEKA